jgi:RHS repeat-associated protein
MKKIRVFTSGAILIVVSSLTQCTAQVATGTPPFGAFGGGPDVINLGNLNAHLTIPILGKAGRGQNFVYNLGYDTSVWSPVAVNGVSSWQPASGWGWKGLSPTGPAYVGYNETYTSGTCGQFGQYTWQSWVYNNLIYVDQNGVVHRFSGAGGSYTSSTGTPPTCPPTAANPPSQLMSSAQDGSGLSAYWQVSSSGFAVSIGTTNGTTISAPVIANYSNPSGNYASTDSNGNEITASNGTYTDTLGTQALVVAAVNNTLTTLSYAAPSGSSAKYQVNFTQYTVATDFNVGSIRELGPTSTPLVSSISLPDGTSYGFSYEKTPGSCTPLANTYATNCVTARLTGVTLPTGGTITYLYQGGTSGTGIYSDGSTAGLKRTLSPGGAWVYARGLVSGSPGSGSTWTTTVTDPTTPTNNQTVLNFTEDGNSTSTYNLYETQKKVYQGSSTSGTLLVTQILCYNGNYASCGSASVSSPISQTDTYTVLPNNSARLSELHYQTNGLVTNDEEFDFGVAQGSPPGTSQLIQQTVTSYTALGEPSQVTVDGWTNGSSAQLSRTTYTYDQTAVTATSGTPQHASVTGNRGNLTTLAQVANSGTTLYQTFSYYDTGTLNTSTGLSSSSTSPGPSTTYLYGTGSCGNSFVTQVNEPMSLSRSFTWNCTGGLQTQVTDENSHTIKTNYTDPDFWRPANTYDQENNETLISYSGQTQTNSTMTFNSNRSVSGGLVTVDGFGRPILHQKAQAPGASTYDTTETDYNVVGLANRSTMPFSASAGGTNSSAPGVLVTYDALDRTVTTTDNDGGITKYQYTNNDVLQTVSGSQNFKKQFEYDGLGRLTSVCEISTVLPGVGTCGQSTQQSGYWTKYTYDALGHLLIVTQNAQAASGSQQLRSYSYDQLGRLTSESNPETSNTASNGTTTYTYDVACTTTAASPGDLTKRVDNAGNNTCFGYDSLHRPSAQGWNTVCRFFAYDNNVTPPSGVTVQNTKSRLLEAWTSNCGSTQYTDEWFSYSSRGELTDFYEKTPHSSVYYHTSTTYWASGSLATLTGIPSVPTMYFGASDGSQLDSEGRYTQVTASSAPNPVTSITYSTSSTTNPLGALTGVTYGSSDSDSFSYDPNTGRAATYNFSVNGKTDATTLGWNSNGTLASLAITDSIPGTADSQSCTISYDDLQRSSAMNCGSTGSQSYSYDPFGNISKTANGLGLSFLPTSYNARNQPVVSGMTFNANGNTTTDNLANQYTWDPNWGIPSSVGSVTVISDAFGRVVEQGSGSTYSEMLWSPVGKVAILNGATLTKALVSLPGGGTAAYTTSGLSYYRHADWLGSSRLASTQARGLYSSSAYAPFGEQYKTAGTADASFTGQDPNTVSSLYDFMDRRYSPSQGRWVLPDPAGVAAVDTTNPQSWNRYAYVLNNPLFYVDPFGDDTSPSICYLLAITGCGGTGGNGSGGYWVPLWFAAINSQNDEWGFRSLLTWVPGVPGGASTGTGDASGGGAPNSNPLVPVASNTVACSYVSGPNQDNQCKFACSGNNDSVGGANIGIPRIQQACPPARPGCPSSLDLTVPSGPWIVFGAPSVVPNSCVYSRKPN